MNIKEIKNELLNEKYYDIDHPSGLKILVMPKENYSSTYAIFATKYGSIDTMIQMKDGSFKEIPEGTAHFLEHKLFESEDLDAFERFAKTGASANAYTSFDRTGYLFSCSANFKKNLEILLDFVQNPYFTQATVEKEQGIIGQEIDMYKDVPDWEVMFNCLMNMYHNLPVRIDIAGTHESIAQISAETLYGCYDNFYNLHNMVLSVAGNVSVDEVIEVADKMLKPVEGKMAQRKVIDEPKEVVSSYVEEKLSVATPQFMFGFKENRDTPERTAKEEVTMEILLDMISGQSSELYRRLFDGKLINNSFGFEYFTGFGYSCVFFAGESTEPKAVADEIVKEIKSFRENGFDKAAFDRTKKKLYGRMIMGMNDVDGIANNMAISYFAGEDIFTDFEIYKTVTLEDVEELFKNTLDENYSVLSVIKPN
ncbi:MAG: pitrilysin family protein [Oscillospiraceae bacterium]|nr:pitrilysin family protein [Clostridiaceae bacterium]MDD7615400.1 pitrilysin family protein [Clostridiaceae bacterium]MDY5889502.1 pitrilysin family protein [Oscillospiraceae bacterium]MDY5934734.1 pitrilysin family protein [Oscillospiraceae bacterium]